MLGDRIKELRTAQGISQVELSHRLGVSKQSVSNWENDNIAPSIEVLKKIASYFHCSADYLLELDNSNKAIIEITDLSIQQTAHIQQLISDFQILNRKLNQQQK